MSNELDDDVDQIDLSARSQDTTNEFPRPSSSRLSSASRRKQHHFNDEISSSKSPNDHQLSNNNDEEQQQPTIHDSHHPSHDVNELSNDGPHIDDSTDHHENEKPPTPKGEKKKKRHPFCQFEPVKWLDLQRHPQKTGETAEPPVKKPNELEDEIPDPPGPIEAKILDRVQGSLVGLALGDALGAHVEFRPYEYMKDHLVEDLEGGGTWGLDKGQFTDDTSMALCLATSLLARKDFIPYDQLVRYKWWSKSGYMSSTGQCFDIGAATNQSIHEFEYRQKVLLKEIKKENEDLSIEDLDYLSDINTLSEFDVFCSDEDAAGNGALMRLAPVPLFFSENALCAVEFSGISGALTHGAKEAYDACRFYGALIVAALRGYSKTKILAPNFYSSHRHWFGEEPLHDKIKTIAEGSYKRRRGYQDKIRGKGYIVSALEAALWAFWSDGDSFEKGVLAAVNLGDDTDTTAAIYGQLAGAFYGFQNLPEHWINQIYAIKFIKKISKWIVYEGDKWAEGRKQSALRRSAK